MPDVFGIGTSALKSFQQAIATTGQNIANVNTEGYSRQSVEFVTNTPERLGPFFIGSGVATSSIERAFDQFLTQDVQNRASSFAFFDNLADAAGRVDELFADDSTGVGPALETFFASMEAVANSPTTLPERQVMISEAGTLAERFEYFDDRLREFQSELNIKINAAVEDINQFAQSIATFNEQVSLQFAQTGGNPSGDLLDERDKAIKGLAELVKVTTVAQDDGSINVFIGKGQSLVTGGLAETLGTGAGNNFSGQVEIFITAGATGQPSANITSLLSEGVLGAALDAGSGVIDNARRNIGLLAVGLTDTFNSLHSTGYDLNGDTGIDFFDASALEPGILLDADNAGTGTLDATVVDVSQLTGDVYRVTQNAADVLVINLTTGATQTVAGPTFTVDGVEYTLGGTSVAGDQYTISPTENAARNFAVAISEPDQVAAAEIPNAPGDNRVMLSLISLQDQGLMDGGATYLELYTNTTSEVAVATRRATSLAETEASLLASAEGRKDNLVGVNLEEEAADLIRFQQAFQAAAQVISTARDVFDTLLRATDR